MYRGKGNWYPDATISVEEVLANFVSGNPYSICYIRLKTK